MKDLIFYRSANGVVNRCDHCGEFEEKQTGTMTFAFGWAFQHFRVCPVFVGRKESLVKVNERKEVQRDKQSNRHRKFGEFDCLTGKFPEDFKNDPKMAKKKNPVDR